MTPFSDYQHNFKFIVTRLGEENFKRLVTLTSEKCISELDLGSSENCKQGPVCDNTRV